MILREIQESDLPTIFEHENDSEACQIAAYPVRNLESFMQHWREKILGDPSAKKKAIVIKEQVVGNIVSWEKNNRRFIGYCVAGANGQFRSRDRKCSSIHAIGTNTPNKLISVFCDSKQEHMEREPFLTAARPIGELNFIWSRNFHAFISSIIGRGARKNPLRDP